MPGESVNVDEVRTRRLEGKRLRQDDFELLCTLYEDPRVTATLGGLRTTGETREILENGLQHWEQYGFGLWIFRDQTSGVFVGRGGLRRVNLEGGTETEVAYALPANHWGRGLATEMAQVSVEIAFGRLNLTDVVSFTLPTNGASRRVMEKVGFSYERDIVHVDLPHVLYRMTVQQI